MEMGLRLVYGLISLLVGCGPAATAASPSAALDGTWVFDPSRAERLFVVTAAPEGPERERALERTLRDMKDLEIVFAKNHVTLSTGLASRTVEFRVRQVEGSVVDLERLRDGQWIHTALAVEGDAMTWFDSDGEIEFVLRRR